MTVSISWENNFDIVRLIAALQVAVHHTMTHLQVQNIEILGGGRHLSFRFLV